MMERRHEVGPDQSILNTVILLRMLFAKIVQKTQEN